MAVPANMIRIAAAVGSEGSPLLPIYILSSDLKGRVTYVKATTQGAVHKSSGGFRSPSQDFSCDGDVGADGLYTGWLAAL